MVSSVSRFAPLSLNWTPDTPTLSDAVTETVMIPETVCPARGEVRDMAGGVESGELLATPAAYFIPPKT